MTEDKSRAKADVGEQQSKHGLIPLPSIANNLHAFWDDQLVQRRGSRPYYIGKPLTRDANAGCCA